MKTKNAGKLSTISFTFNRYCVTLCFIFEQREGEEYFLNVCVVCVCGWVSTFSKEVSFPDRLVKIIRTRLVGILEEEGWSCRFIKLGS